MDEVLNGKLENISELSAEELSSLKEDIKTQYTDLRSQELTKESADSIVSLANAMKTIKGESVRRDEEAKELEALATQADQIIADDEAEGDPDAEEVVEEAIEEEDEASAAPAEEEVPPAEEEVPAEEEEEEIVEDFSADSEEPEEATEELSQEAPVEELSAETEAESDEEAELSVDDSNTESDVDVTTVNTEFSAPDENAPSGETVEKKVATIVAAADLRGVQSGSVIPSRLALADALIDRRAGMGRTSGGDGEQALVASIKTDHFYGKENTLLSNDTEGNREKVEAMVASAKNRDPEAIVAAGGLYAPVETSYDIYELGETTVRPVKDSLPSFKADRGGLRFMTPPMLGDLKDSTSVWTLQDDIEAAAPDSTLEKPCLRIEAGEEITVYIEALPLCLTFGNIGARTFPEMVERHIELAMVWQARFAEQRLLTRIGSLSTQVTAAAQLGAARDLLVQLDKAGAALRNRHRLEPGYALRAIFPLWFKNALRSDLVKQMPGDGQEAAFNLAESTIDQWFSSRNVSVTWTYDGESSQYFNSQGDGALVDFPSTVVWYLFPEGTFLFLEEATLDLGIVRDSTLNATNDYKMFIEGFENVAKVGVESLRIESGVKIAGATAGTVNTLA